MLLGHPEYLLQTRRIDYERPQRILRVQSNGENMSTDITETIDGLVLRREQLKAEIAERELEIYSINSRLESMVEGMSGKVSVNGVNLRVRELLPTTRCDSDRLKS